MSVGAFRGSEQLRTELIADLMADGKKVQQWLDRTPVADGQPAAGDQHGFHPAFTCLVAGLAGDLRTDDARQFITDVLRALPLEADTRDAVRCWFIQCWADDSFGLETHFRDSVVYEDARAVIDLIETSRNRTVGPRDWRSARSKIAKAEGLPVDAAEYAEVILAMGWDIDLVPDVALDVVGAWERAIMRTTLAVNGWTDILGDELETLSTALHEKALESIDQKADQQTLIRSFKENFERLGSETPRYVELSERMKDYGAIAMARGTEWMGLARSTFVAIASSQAGMACRAPGQAS